MKLKVTALLAALSMLVLVAGAGAQDYYYTTPKKKPKLTLKVKPKRDKKKPYKFKASGTLKRPSGVSKSKGCKGTVTVRFKGKKGKTVKAKVKSNCTYKAKTVKLKKKGKYKVTATFGGNARLKKATSKTVKVKAG